MRLGLPILGSALILACGSSSDKAQPDSVSGVLDGTAFVAKGSLGFRPAVETCTHAGTTGPVLVRAVHLDGSLDSAFLQSHACSGKASSKVAELFIWTFAASGDIAPGTYPKRDDSSGGQVVIWAKGDAACQTIGDNVISTSGSVVIETNDATHIVGSLDVTFPGGDRLSGRFDAPVVPSPINGCELFGWPGGTPGPGCPNYTCIP
jgi:hypothetical protein